MAEINLKAFCGIKGETKFDIDAPFFVGGFVYATDTRIIVRMPGKHRNSSGLRLPDVASIWTPRPTTLIWPAPTYDWKRRERPDTSSDFWGWTPDPSHQEICGQVVRSTYHYLISRLPNVKFSPGKRNWPIYFTFDDGEGMLQVCER